MVSLLAKLQFLCLQLVCTGLDAVPRLAALLMGRGGRGVLRAWAPPALSRLFGLAAVDGARYTDPPIGGHAATILCALRPQRPVPYDREVTPGGDGNPMCIDWHLCRPGAGNGCVLVVFPGLSSWSGTNYIQRFVQCAHDRGFHCAVFNARGLGDTPLERPRLMSAVWTEDIRAAVRSGPLSREAIARRVGAPATAVVGVGFSLGGVILSKFHGEECRAGRPPFDAALLVNSPLDTLTSDAHTMTPLNRAVYQPSMTGGLLAFTRRHAAVLGGIAGLSPPVHAAFAAGEAESVLRHMKTVADFDRLITCPANGFPTTESYYRDIMPLRWIAETTVPLLCISACDDPVCGEPPLHRMRAIQATNGNVGVATTPHGGHLGYVRGLAAEWRQEPSLMDTLVCQLCDTFTANHAATVSPKGI